MVTEAGVSFRRHGGAAEEVDREQLSRCIAFVNGKGGVGKTTSATNIGGILALSGYKVLIGEMDPQGNVGRDLGYRFTERDDDGRSLSAALAFGQPIEILRDVRENLDVIRAGSALDVAAAALAAGSVAGDPRDALARILAPVAGNYDIILIDCPPGIESLQNAAIAAARWVVVPTKVDAGSEDGLVVVSKRIAKVVDINPRIDLLGVALFDVEAQATRVRAEARADLGAVVGDASLVFDSVVRHSTTFARDSRKYGALAHELEEFAAKEPAWWEIRRGTSAEGPRVSRTAGNIAEDIQGLAGEIVQRLTERERQEATA